MSTPPDVDKLDDSTRLEKPLCTTPSPSTPPQTVVTNEDDAVLAVNNGESALKDLSPVPSYEFPPIRTVELSRDPEWNLGISIVGGRVQEGEEHKLKGIYIKHVLETSPAGKSGILKTGDQILQVTLNFKISQMRKEKHFQT